MLKLRVDTYHCETKPPCWCAHKRTGGLGFHCDWQKQTESHLLHPTQTLHGERYLPVNTKLQILYLNVSFISDILPFEAPLLMRRLTS